MSDHIFRRLRWFLLLGMSLFLIGLALSCIEALRTAAWMNEAASRPDNWSPTEAEADRWSSSVEIDIKLIDWVIVLVPLGAGATLGAVASLAWLTRGRFRLRSLLIGMTFLCLVLGIPLGLVRPHLHDPRFVYYPEFGYAKFEQHGKPASNSSYPVLNLRIAMTALAPLLILPIIFFAPKRLATCHQ
jgi:hypothetical protein